MNVDVPCPQCGTIFTVRHEILGKRTKCTKCGAAFVLTAPAAGPSAIKPGPPPIPASIFPEIRTAPPSLAPDAPLFNMETGPRSGDRKRPSGEVFGFEQDATQPRFPALRMVARAYEVMAILVLAFAAFMLLMFVIAVIREPSAIGAAILASGFTFFWSAVAAVTMLFVAQTIRLGLQVEQNTRETQIACRQLADHLCSVESER